MRRVSAWWPGLLVMFMVQGVGCPDDDGPSRMPAITPPPPAEGAQTSDVPPPAETDDDGGCYWVAFVDPFASAPPMAFECAPHCVPVDDPSRWCKEDQSCCDDAVCNAEGICTSAERGGSGTSATEGS